MRSNPPAPLLHLPRLTKAMLLCSLGIPATAHAAQSGGQMLLEPSVVSGSRSAAQSFDLPFSVDSLGREQISDGQLGINASEVLNRVPGLVVQNRQNYAQDLQISSRGFGARSAFGVRGLKLISDGIPASTPDGQGQAATFNLDTAERIEVLRGPVSTLYGSNAGGVIQMFSRDGIGRPRIGAETLVGSDGLTRNNLTAEGESDGVGFVLDASRMDTDGYRDHSAARRDQNFAKLNFKPDEDSKLALIYSSLEQNGTQDPLGQAWEAYKADPRSVAVNALNFNTRKSIDHQQLGVNYERYFGDATLQTTAYAGKRSVIQYLAIPQGPQGNPNHSGGVVDFDREFHGGSVRWLQPVDGISGDLRLVFGVDYDQSRDERRGYENFSGSQIGVKGNLRRDEVDTVTSLDPYAQATWNIGNWTLQGGLRYSTVEVDVDDKYIVGANGDDSGTRRYEKATPSVSVGYAFTADMNGYVSVGKGFETPSQAELAYSQGNAGFNYGLEPSESTQYEIGLKAHVAQGTRVNAAIFQINTDDEVVVLENSGGRTSYQNAGKTLRRGFELGVESQLDEQWSAALAYTYLAATYDSRFAAGNSLIDKGNDLPGVPRTTLFGELAWKPVDGISTALEGLYRSKVYVEDSNTQRPAPSYAVFNWRTGFTQHFGPWKTHQTLRLDNLLDRQYVGSVIVGDGNGRFYEAAPGRSWFASAGIEYQF